MKFLFVLSIICFASILNDSASCSFVTGPDLWYQNKPQSKYMAAAIFRPKHAQFVENGDKFLIFKDTLEMHEENKISRPMVFNLENCIDEDLSLELQMDPIGAIQLKVFLAFNEAMLELIDMEQELIQGSKYCHQDLTLIKKFYKQSLIFVKKSEDICLSLLDNKKSTFSESKFLQDLKPIYVNADKLNANLDKMRNDIRQHQAGVLTLQQYIKYFSYIRYVLNRNGLFFVAAHLESTDSKTKKFLNPKRNVTGNITNFDFDLIKGLSDLELNAFASSDGNQNESCCNGNQGNNEAITNTKSGDQSIVPEVQQEKTDYLQIHEPTLILQNLAEEKTTEKNAESIKDKTELKEVYSRKFKKEVKITNKDENRKYEIREEKEKKYSNKEVDKLDEIDALLQEYDGGPHKGMKTRRFLRLCSALNAMGYFSSFEANRKEVKIKTHSTGDGQPGDVSVLHTNHSNKSNDTGITRPTAEKLAQIIRNLKVKKS